MLKYLWAEIRHDLIPFKTTLCISITGYENQTVGSFGNWISEGSGLGFRLTPEELDLLIEDNDGINCVCIISEFLNDSDFDTLSEVCVEHDCELALFYPKENKPDIDYSNFNYVKYDDTLFIVKQNIDYDTNNLHYELINYESDIWVL